MNKVEILNKKNYVTILPSKVQSEYFFVSTKQFTPIHKEVGK